jgi:DNA-binding response OmpR family regulator
LVIDNIVISINKILIIDDDEDISNLFKGYLEQNGFKVDAYTDLLDALCHFNKDTYDLILFDLKMPLLDGISMYKELKKKDKKITICLITADIIYLEQLKEKIPSIEKFIIYKPILLRNLKDKIDLLILEKNSMYIS